MTTLADVQGHWVRHWIKAPGAKDHTTRVHWIQAGHAYADVRIPADRPDLSGASSLSDLSAQQLAALARAEGFAGRITLDGAVCTWARDINWHGTPDAADIGHISFDAQGRMIEAGVEADYTELWERAEAPPPTARHYRNGGDRAFIVSAGNRFVIGIGRPGRRRPRRSWPRCPRGRCPAMSLDCSTAPRPGPLGRRDRTCRSVDPALL